MKHSRFSEEQIIAIRSEQGSDVLVAGLSRERMTVAKSRQILRSA